MALSNHKIYCKKDGTTYAIDLYTVPKNTGTNDKERQSIKVGGQTLYYRTTSTSNSGESGGNTPLRIKKPDGTTYKVLQHGIFYIKINPSANQTITCTAGGKSWTSGTYWFPYGTKWTAKVTGSAQYNPGKLNATSGTLTDDNVTLTATTATLAEVRFAAGTKTTWTCPSGITKIEVDGNMNTPYAVTVVPGRTYRVELGNGDRWGIYYDVPNSKYDTEYYVVGDDTPYGGQLYVRSGGDLIIRYKVTTTRVAEWGHAAYYDDSSGS